MKIIFKKCDFKLCDVPVPQGYPQSQTHSGISCYCGNYYLTTSPFPSFNEKHIIAYFKAIIRKMSRGKLFNQCRAESYENPLLYVGVKNLEEPPTSFLLMQKRPMMEEPDDYYGLPAFNSDPDIYIEDNTIRILNRQVYRTKLCPGEPLNKYENRLYLISGEIDGEKFKLDRIQRICSTEKRMIVSPCLYKYRGTYVLLSLETNSYNEGTSFEGLYFISSKEIAGLRDNDKWEKVEVLSNGYLPWHMSVFGHNDRLYAIVAAVKVGEKQRCWQLFGEFNEDLSKLVIYSEPLTDYKSYRGSACVNEKGDFVLYSTTVHEKISGSKSVDGRDVIMAHMPFDELLKKIRTNE